MRKQALIVLAVALLAIFAASCKNNKNKNQDMTADLMDGPVVEMKTSKGTMKIKLYNATPRHRDNFLKLVREEYYDSIKFHRVIKGFMIQAGDPLSKVDTLRNQWGTGGPDYTVPAEFVSELTHVKGALAAARMGDMANPRKASSGSQFYIVQSEGGCQHLNGEYTVFGQVIEGLDVIDKIAGVETDPYDRPLEPVIIKSARVEEPVDSTIIAAADSLKK